MNITKKHTGVLIMNARILPKDIAHYKQKGHHHQAKALQRMLDETRAELTRRGVALT